MSYAVACLCILFGAFALLWIEAPYFYNCHIGGKPISSLYFNSTASDSSNGNEDCSNFVTMQHGPSPRLICCYLNQQNPSPRIVGSGWLGTLYIIHGALMFLTESPSIGWGLFYRAKNDGRETFLYKNRISPVGILNFIVGALGLWLPVTLIASVSLLVLSGVQMFAAYRREAGNGSQGRGGKPLNVVLSEWWKYLGETARHAYSFKIVDFFKRIVNEDKVSVYVWVSLFLLANFVTFVYTLFVWYDIIGAIRGQLLDGTLALGGIDRLSHMSRKAVRYGPPTYVAAWAKGFGVCLNLDCALILLPVTKGLLRRLNNIGVSLSNKRLRNEHYLITKIFALPFTRYVPLAKNIEFHKLCAFMILFCTTGHMVCHFINLGAANTSTSTLFRNYLGFPVLKWDGAAFFTGSVIVLAMLFIFTSALDKVRAAKYEIFFACHHFFTVFFVFFFLHGPHTFYFAIIPVLLYAYERYLQTRRGKKPFLVCKVDYIKPVMVVYIRPVFKVRKCVFIFFAFYYFIYLP